MVNPVELLNRLSSEPGDLAKLFNRLALGSGHSAELIVYTGNVNNELYLEALHNG